jgi:hypothetical protein
MRYECNIAYRRQLYAFYSLLKLKQIHNLKNRVVPHIISDYMENPRPTFFENSTISILCVKNLRKIGLFEICFFINFYATIARFLIRTRVKYPATLKFLDQIFLNLAQYFRMDERTIVPILSNFRHFSMLLQFTLKQ